MARPRLAIEAGLLGAAVVMAQVLPAPADAADKTISAFHNAALKRNYEKAAELLTAAAERGDANAQYRLGSLYRLGLGVPQDQNQARNWFTQSAAKGDKRAAEILARSQVTVPPTASADKTGARPAPTPGTFMPPVDANGRGAGGLTWLMRASGRGNVEVLAALLQTGSAIDARLPDGSSALSLAIRTGAEKAVRFLLQSGAVAAGTEGSRQPQDLILAAGHGKSAIVNDLLAAGADPAQRDGLGRTALHAAARSCDSATIGVLLQKPFPVAPDDVGQTPLHIAVESCTDAGFIEQLIPGEDIDATDAQGRTALWDAVAAGKTEIVERLLARGAKPDIADANGLAPLHVAAAAGDAKSLQHLIDGGADRNVLTATGNTALMFAAASKCVECVVLLPQSRDTIDHQNNLGDTALIVATRVMVPDIVRLLVAAGADPSARNSLRDTPVKIATRLEDPDLLAALQVE